MRYDWDEPTCTVANLEVTDTPPGRITVVRWEQSFVDRDEFDSLLKTSGGGGSDFDRVQPGYDAIGADTKGDRADAFNRAGFRWGHKPRKPFWGDMRQYGFDESWWLMVPMWSLAILFGVLPSMQVASRFSRRK